MFLCFPGWACQRSLDCWRGEEAVVVGHREQWLALESGQADARWIPRGDWSLVTWSMGTWAGLALSQMWGQNPPKNWLALSPFLELCPESGGRVEREELETLLGAFRKNAQRTLGMFEKRQGGKSLWSEGLGPQDDNLLERSLEALLQPCPWQLDPGATELPLKVELGSQDRLVGEEQSRAFASCFSKAQVEIRHQKSHALFYEDECET